MSLYTLISTVDNCSMISLNVFISPYGQKSDLKNKNFYTKKLLLYVKFLTDKIEGYTGYGYLYLVYCF